MNSIADRIWAKVVRLNSTKKANTLIKPSKIMGTIKIYVITLTVPKDWICAILMNPITHTINRT